MPQPSGKNSTKKFQFTPTFWSLVSIAVFLLLAPLVFTFFGFFIPAVIVGSFGLLFTLGAGIFFWIKKDAFYFNPVENRLKALLKDLIDIYPDKETSRGLFFVAENHSRDHIVDLFLELQDLLKKTDAAGVALVMNECLTIMLYFRNYVEQGHTSGMTQAEAEQQYFFLGYLDQLFEKCIEQLDESLKDKTVDSYDLLNMMMDLLHVFDTPFIKIPLENEKIALRLLPIELYAKALTKVAIASDDIDKILGLIADFEKFQTTLLSDFLPPNVSKKAVTSEWLSNQLKPSKEVIEAQLVLLREKQASLQEKKREPENDEPNSNRKHPLSEDEDNKHLASLKQKQALLSGSPNPKNFASPLASAAKSGEKSQQEQVQIYFKKYWDLDFLRSSASWFDREERALFVSVYRATPPGSAEKAAKKLAEYINRLFEKEIATVKIGDELRTYLNIHPDHFSYILIKAKKLESEVASAFESIKVKDLNEKEEWSFNEHKIKKYLETYWNFMGARKVWEYICQFFHTKEAACHYALLVNRYGWPMDTGRNAFVVQTEKDFQLRIPLADITYMAEAAEKAEKQAQENKTWRWW